MKNLEDHAVVGVVGAGTMGTGIAQVAAVGGHPVRIFDAVAGAAERAVERVIERIEREVARGRLSVEARDLDLAASRSLAELAPANVVIEAVIEDLAVKQQLFAELEEVVAQKCILASNTSSLSPTALAAPLKYPGRLIGLHFFNPAPVMRLIEVIPGLATDPSVTEAAVALATTWGKTPVRSSATPGFIVNRVARPFYAEAWRVYEEGAADASTIDAILTGAGGFRMGPFALMDLIGHDVNEAVTRQVWAAFGYDPRFAPSLAQRALVEAGWLGRKTGRGVYDYTEGAEPPAPRPAAPTDPPPAVIDHDGTALRPLLDRAGTPVRPAQGNAEPGQAPLAGVVELPSGALLVRCEGTTATEQAARLRAPVIVVDRSLDDRTATGVALAASDGCPPESRDQAIGLLQAAGLAVYPIDDTPGLVVTRSVAMLVNTAVDAIRMGVADAADVDTAMRLGTNYPIGPLAWGDRWGPATVHGVLVALQASYGDPHYRPSPLLARHAASGAPLRPGTPLEM